MTKGFILVFVVTLIIGCAQTTYNSSYLQYENERKRYVELLSWVLHADPDKDFEKAIKKGDMRFLGLYGINNPIPRIEKSCVDVEKDVHYIIGTAEILMGYEHVKLNAVAYEYASHYNDRMLRHKRENGSFKCDL